MDDVKKDVQAGLTKDEIRAKIKKIVVDNLGVSEDQVTDDAMFTQDLGADSLDQVELVMSLEEEFGAEIRDEDADSLNTVGDAINYIAKRIADKAE